VTTAILFDLGNTLVSYYRRDQFAEILDNAIRGVIAELNARGIASIAHDAAYTKALSENRESEDFRVKPMIGRLQRIFGLSAEDIGSLGEILCTRFLEPIFDVARVYEDTIPALERLRTKGYRTAIVSNLPWGSPTKLWREELRRLEMAELVDAVVLCGDVGWRKPARQIFMHALQRLDVSCDQSIFVGDDLEWDIEGSKAVGLQPVLIDRDNMHVDYVGKRISDLRDLG
jgi:putative hydrolase of the HAD superfamily